MISNPKYGWCDFKLRKFRGRPSIPEIGNSSLFTTGGTYSKIILKNVL